MFMTSHLSHDQPKKIGWNSISMVIPASWEFRVAGKKHLVFEDDFTPLLQLEWELGSHQQELAKFSLPQDQNDPGGFTPDQDTGWEQLTENFLCQPINRNATSALEGLLQCKTCATTFHFQLLRKSPETEALSIEALRSLRCHSHENGIPWTLLDTTFLLPGNAVLQQYGFKAGLCWASCQQDGNIIQIARLAPAERRLAEASVEDILRELSGTDSLLADISPSADLTMLYRAPGLLGQIKYRMRRQLPFVQCVLQHQHEKNLLKACLLFSKAPVLQQTVLNYLPVT